MLRIACSKENPCQACLTSASQGSERKVLSFCYCVRTRFADVNIFANDDRIGDVGDDVTAQLSKVIDGQPLDRSPANFEEILVEWLRNPESVLPNGSLIHSLTSAIFSKDIEEVLGADMAIDFRVFLFATSLAHTQWDGGGWSNFYLRRAAQISGSRIIRRLDHFLTPQFVAKLGRDASRGVFLFVLGVILGIGYFGDSMEVLGSKFRKSPTLWLTMKEHICQMLAHHLIFIGSTIGIKLDTAAEQSIIDGAIGRWRKTEMFGWARQQSAVNDVEHVEKTGRPLPAKSWATGDFVTIPCDDVLKFHNLDLGSDAVAVAEGLEGSSSSNRETEDVNPDYYSATQDFDWQSFSSEPLLPATGASTSLDDRQSTGTEKAEGTKSERPKLGDKTDSGFESLPYRNRKKRSVWIVRPFDVGGRPDPCSVHARYRVGEGQPLGLFA